MVCAIEQAKSLSWEAQETYCISIILTDLWVRIDGMKIIQVHNYYQQAGGEDSVVVQSG